MPAIRQIQSKHNASLKLLRAALLKSPSKTGGLVALEGFHLLEEALVAGIEVQTIFVATGHESLLHTLAIPSSVEILSVAQPVFDASVTTESPQPIAALVTQPSWPWSRTLSVPCPLLVVLAGVQDPGNLGAILRSAEAFGASGAILLPGTVSPWNPKAMRASAGSVFRLPTLSASVEDCFARLATASIPAIAAAAHNAEPLSAFRHFNAPLALVIGSEGAGIPPPILARCAHRVTIPCPGPVESLNAAVAAGILLYQASLARQKQ